MGAERGIRGLDRAPCADCSDPLLVREAIPMPVVAVLRAAWNPHDLQQVGLDCHGVDRGYAEPDRRQRAGLAR
jgi:hypothetical protein